MKNKFERIYIDENSIDSDLAQRCLTLYPEIIEFVTQRPFSKTRGELSAKEFDRSKRNLYVTRYEGKFFRRCPGAKPGLLCCNYFVLNWGLQCDMNCSYCYLQSFINNPVMTLYSNLDEALEELNEIHGTLKDTRLRVGTGETVDSLSLDPLTGNAERMIIAFRDFPNWTVEFKTKSALVDQFLHVPHAGNAIVSWSLNPNRIIAAEEHGTASLEDRLAAAERCLAHGFPIAFHIDPIIWHPNWEESYFELVDEICQRFRPEQIPYLSLGALRFQPDQRHMMRERFGMQSLVLRNEMHPGQDGKLRYSQDLRRKMFDLIQKRFMDNSANWKIFLCMETPETWLQNSEESPFKRTDLKELFDPKVTRAVHTNTVSP